MSVVKVHRLAVVGDNQAELEKRFAAARHIADSFPGFEGFELWRPLDEGGDYFVVTRWVMRQATMRTRRLVVSVTRILLFLTLMAP